MKLRSLYVEQYQVLRDLTVSFQASEDEADPADSRTYGLNFLVGANGTGKSTVMRALAHLFRKLYRGPMVDFPSFTLAYDWYDDAGKSVPVVITNRGPEGRHLPEAIMTVRGVARWDDRMLPERVICYTTGTEGVWLEADEPDEASRPAGETAAVPGTIPAVRDSYLRELPDQAQSEESPTGEGERVRNRVQVVRAARLPHAVIGGLVTALGGAGEKKEHRLSAVFHEAGIESIAGFSLRLRVQQYLLTGAQSDTVRRLQACATRTIAQGTERLLVFDWATHAKAGAEQLAAAFGTGYNLFEELDWLSEPIGEEEPVLQEVSIFVQRLAQNQDEGKQSKPMLHLFNWLSDGERGFLSRMCLLAMLGTSRALVLVDEPEVHFNDYWKRQIVHMLDASLKDQHSHVLVATHSSIAVTDVKSRDVRVLVREGAFTTSSNQPDIQTFAADPSDIMVHIFGAPYPIGEYSRDQLEQKLREVELEQKLGGVTDLKELDKYLAGVAPGYWSFRLRQAAARRERR